MNLDQTMIETWLEGIVRRVVREEQLQPPAPVPVPVPECMTRKQCAKYFQVSELSIFNWQNRPEAPLPHAYVGDEPRYYLAEIQQWSRDEAVRQKKKTTSRRKTGKKWKGDGTIRATLTAATTKKKGGCSGNIQTLQGQAH